MTPKPDRELMTKACDFIEDGGFDYDQVQILRSLVFNNCQPKVNDVVEIAMQAQRQTPGTCDGVLDAARKGRVPVLEGLVDVEGSIGLLCRKLLEMTATSRWMVFICLEYRIGESIEAGQNPATVV